MNTQMTPLDTLVNTAQLIEFLKDPNYASRIPELIEAKETIAQAEVLRHDLAAFNVAKEAFAAQEQELAAREEAAQAAAKANESEAVAIAEAYAQLQVAKDVHQAGVAALAGAQDAIRSQEAALAVATAKAASATAQAKASTKASDELIAEYKTKLETLSKL